MQLLAAPALLEGSMLHTHKCVYLGNLFYLFCCFNESINKLLIGRFGGVRKIVMNTLNGARVMRLNNLILLVLGGNDVLLPW